MSAVRRCELLLPLRFNDGSLISPELVGETLVDLRSRFGAVSSDLTPIGGSWTHEETTYREESVRELNSFVKA